MDDFFSSLDEISVKEEEQVKKCCDDTDNHLLGEGMIICKICNNTISNIIDTAEWRFYGANDSKSSDPTRCGMPINPLLVESSYGCKVMCNGSTTYEMRKIRRYTEWQSMPYKEKSQYDEFQRIQILSKHAGIPKLIIDEALRYHKKISEILFVDIDYQNQLNI